jgi:hypothetical protein
MHTHLIDGSPFSMARESQSGKPFAPLLSGDSPWLASFPSTFQDDKVEGEGDPAGRRPTDFLIEPSS